MRPACTGLSAELAPFGVRCADVLPGMITTAMNPDDSPGPAGIGGGDRDPDGPCVTESLARQLSLASTLCELARHSRAQKQGLYPCLSGVNHRWLHSLHVCFGSACARSNCLTLIGGTLAFDCRHSYRRLPATSVAKAVWECYSAGERPHIHWFVPKDLESLDKAVAQDREAARDMHATAAEQGQAEAEDPMDALLNSAGFTAEGALVAVGAAANL